MLRGIFIEGIIGLGDYVMLPTISIDIIHQVLQVLYGKNGPKYAN